MQVDSVPPEGKDMGTTDYKACLDAFCNEMGGCHATHYPQYSSVNIDFWSVDTPIYLKVFRTSTGNHLGYSHITYKKGDDPYKQAIESILGCTLVLPACCEFKQIKVPRTLEEFVRLYSIPGR